MSRKVLGITGKMFEEKKKKKKKRGKAVDDFNEGKSLATRSSKREEENAGESSQWKKMVTKVTFGGPGFSRKPLKCEWSICPSGLRFDIKLMSPTRR
ncbi:hypothetical protein MLD38_011058 [Melastoma candidum]|uniref:Uncharacterized protein n=1 Tax=Melastoma candidum TaxID=119954 RepID=A0ACB9R5C3_9MYRT|nr:hypothetical protein MLD38_011058 [Melastoma candidum]